MNTAIDLRHISKAFPLADAPHPTLREQIVHWRMHREHKTLTALHDVSLRVGKGEFFGLIGANGSGKSTLLKVIAGIYTPDHGHVAVAGHVAPFLELGIGFHPELSVHENIFLSGTVFGLSRKAIRRCYGDILAFAELENFTGVRIKFLSTGMRSRLAFATLVYIEKPIMLLDEALAVGDADFQEKCVRKLRELKQKGRTIIFVSHDLTRVFTLCDRVGYLKQGSMAIVGDPRTVITQYMSDLGLLSPQHTLVLPPLPVLSSQPRHAV